MPFRRSDYGDSKYVTYKELIEYQKKENFYRFVNESELEDFEAEIGTWEACILFSHDTLVFFSVTMRFKLEYSMIHLSAKQEK